ncbi:MAG: purine-binding chemotaxis protein CheW [Chloroflexi bacterium]|nr:purine-binding chemotaxis protein CheW [Chloroflexota bacterium]
MSALIVFRLGSQRYAIPIATVSEIMAILEARAIPDMPIDWLGVANIRGQVTPIIDLRVRLGLPPRTPPLDAPLIILKHAERQLAVLVDKVERIVQGDPTATLAQASVELYDGELIILLESDKLFADTTSPVSQRKAES